MKSKLSFIPLGLTVVLAISLLMVAYAGAAPAPTKVLKLGVTHPLQIREGLEQQRWLRLFAKLINEEGGWKIGNDRYTIEWIFYNDEYNAEKARTAVERLIFKDNVKLIINQWGSASIIATIKLSEPNKALVIGTCISDEPCKPEYKYVFKGTDPVPFGVGVSIFGALEYKKRGAKTLVTINPDDATGKARTEQDKRSIPSTGLKILDTLFWQRGTVDFGPIATKVKALNPDIAWLAATSGEDITKITVALHDAGYKGIIDCDNMHAGVIKDMVAKVGPEYLEGSMSAFYDAKQYQKDPEMVKYIKAYEKEYGEWNIEGVLWMGPWFTFKGAVEATQSLDVDVLANYLGNNPAPVRTLCGWRTAIARPDLGNLRTIAAVNSVWKGIMKGGKMVPFAPVGSAQMYKIFVESYGMKDIYEKYWKEHGYPKFPD
jgi:ABC-type branched-subunit amino acid transport system substrate-binding protein